MMPVAPYLLALLIPAAPVDGDLCQPDQPPTCSWEFQGDYLWWYLRKMGVPPLVTAAPAGETGILGEADTEVLRSDRLTTRHQRFVGVRVEADGWLPERELGFQVNAFFLERDSSQFTVPYGAVPTLAIPYVDAQTGQPAARIVSGIDPVRGDLIGGMVVYSRSELFGQDANFLIPCWHDESGELLLVAGARFLQLRERLDLTSTSRDVATGSVLYGLEDHLSTFNKFFGAQVGFQGEYRLAGFFVDGKATVALGVDDQTLRLKGATIFNDPTVRTEQPYGLFVLPSNRGSHERGAFDVVTEVKLNVGYEFGPHLRAHLGYSFVAWCNPVRPGDQIQPVNLSQVQPGGLQGPALPDIPWRTEVFWAHGANAGFEIRW
jgi:hypothetical protein